MQIAVYDTLHHETLVTVIRVFSLSGNSVHVFTNDAIAGVLQKSQIAANVVWHVLDDRKAMNIPMAISRENRKRSFSFIILNTVHKHHILYAMIGKRRSKLIVTLHNAAMLGPGAWAGIRPLIRSAGKKLLMKTADGFFVLSSAISAYIKDQELTSKPVFVLPGAIAEETAPAPEEGEFVVTIPGTIDQRRRNYHELVALAPLLKTAKRRLNVVMLGPQRNQPDLNGIRDQVRAANPMLTITTFDVPFIAQEMFDDWLRRSHLIYLPLSPSMESDGEKEFYGKSKVSGGFFDAVRFGKLMLLPCSITVADELKNQSWSYGSVEELANFINKMIHDPMAYKLWEEKAAANASIFNLEKVREQVFGAMNAAWP